MHREIKFAGNQSIFDLLGEQTLAADVGQRPVLNTISGGVDDDGFDSVAGKRRVGGGQPADHLGGLGKRQRTAAGT